MEGNWARWKVRRGGQRRPEKALEIRAGSGTENAKTGIQVPRRNQPSIYSIGKIKRHTAWEEKVEDTYFTVIIFVWKLSILLPLEQAGTMKKSSHNAEHAYSSQWHQLRRINIYWNLAMCCVALVSMLLLIHIFLPRNFQQSSILLFLFWYVYILHYYIKSHWCISVINNWR